MNFSELHLIPPILQAAREAGYEAPSPIQQKAIPPVLAGRDLLGCAQTGTGKTAAFAMPILQRLSEAPAPGGGRPIRALVLTPTRELALQIDESFAAYGRHLPLRCGVIFGGVSQNPQVACLQRGVDILTATPGRLNDLIGQGYIDLSRLEVFVLDEADRMLDMGFVHDVKRVIAQLPPKRQTLLFSATMPREIEELADSLLHRPEKVMVTPPATTVESIEQSVYFVDKGNKKHLLAKLLRGGDVTSALVFTRTKHGADRVVRELARAGIEARAIHGNKSQNARQDALGRFKDGRIRVLVATDIAARGIDVTGLSHVFNYDLPNVPETYVHRIGRTGRAGRAGVAISFCDCAEREYLADIEKLTRRHIRPVAHEWPMQETQPAQADLSAQGRGQDARPPRAARAAAQGAMEDTAMEEQKLERRLPGDAPGEGKKRRRRGGRRHKSGAAAQPGGAEGRAAPAESAKTARQRAGEAEGRRPEGRSPAGRSPAGRSPENRGEKAPRRAADPRPEERAAQRQPAAGEKRGEKAVRTPQPARAQKAAKAAKGRPEPPAAAPQPERDDSLQLITRRAPAQKFASFEEYMKAHGN